MHSGQVLQSIPIGVPGCSSAWSLIDNALGDVRAGEATAKTEMESIKTPVDTALANGHATVDAIAARTSWRHEAMPVGGRDRRLRYDRYRSSR